jgi:hypothetical protein
LESFGRLFKNDLKLYIYPLQDALTGTVSTVETAQVSADLQKLYGYLHDRGSFVALDNFKAEYLPIFSRDVLRRIADHDESWETMVPASVCDLIKKRGFFGYAKGSRS